MPAFDGLIKEFIQAWFINVILTVSDGGDDFWVDVAGGYFGSGIGEQHCCW